MKDNLDSILEQCLSLIGEGKARIQSCLLAYPNLEKELEPLLRAAEWMREVDRPEIPPAARARIEARLLRQVKSPRRLDPASWKWPAFRLNRQWAAATLAAVAIVVTAMSIVTAGVAGAMPGSPAYAIKRTTEQAWLWLTPAASRPAVHLQLARRRLAELRWLATEDSVDASALQMMTDQVEAVLSAAGELPATTGLPLLEQVAELNAAQEQILIQMSGTGQPLAEKDLSAALQVNAEQANRTQEMIRILSAAEPPGQTRTPQPPGQTKTPEPPGQTRTPQPPGQTRTPEPPGQTRTPQPPGQTRTPAPPGQTRTSEPPGHNKTPAPPGQTKTPEPPGHSKTAQPPGQTKTAAPPGQNKTPKPTKTPQEP